MRRHAVPDVDGVLAWAARASDRLLELDGADDRIAALEQQDAELEHSLGVLAAELSAARAAAALCFGEAVTAELAEAGVGIVRTQPELAEAGALPRWLGDEDFHRSHRSALLRKDPAHYRESFGDVPDDLPYVWPPPEEA